MSSAETAAVLWDAIDALSPLAGNEVVADEIERLSSMAQEYERDAAES